MTIGHVLGRVLPRPLWSLSCIHRSGRVACVVLLHVVVGGVGRVLAVLRVGWARSCGNRWIYRYIGVRFELLLMVMVLAIWHRH